MTNEEKARAYDVALEQAKKELNTCGSMDCDAARQIFRFFPQLRESKDERIRKGLIEALKTSKTVGELKFVIPEPTREECLAYLEKQKEQKPVVTHGETYRVDTLGTQQVIAGKMPQKPAEWSDDIIRKAVKEIWLTQHQIDWFKDNVFPSKVEWNEEDEDELQNAIDALEFLGKKGVYKSESGYDAALQAASWLKNLSLDLKKRNEDVTKLCSNEWSEEDEEIFNNIIEKAKGGHWIEVNEITWLIAWFKSLRNRVGKEFLQPHWKPSEEEVRLINTSISFLKDFADKGYENAVECIDWLKSKLNGNSGK